jgi:hypothetical protein
MSSSPAYRSAASPNFEISLRPASSGGSNKPSNGGRRRRTATAHDKALVADIAEVFEAELTNAIPTEAQEEVSRDSWKAVESHLAKTHEHLTQLQNTFRSLRRSSKTPGAQRGPKPVDEPSKGKGIKQRSHMRF